MKALRISLVCLAVILVSPLLLLWLVAIRVVDWALGLEDKR